MENNLVSSGPGFQTPEVTTSSITYTPKDVTFSSSWTFSTSATHLGSIHAIPNPPNLVTSFNISPPIGQLSAPETSPVSLIAKALKADFSSSRPCANNFFHPKERSFKQPNERGSSEDASGKYKKRYHSVLIYFHASRIRTDTTKRVRGPNKYGRKGNLRCQQCRLRNSKVGFAQVFLNADFVKVCLQ